MPENVRLLEYDDAESLSRGLAARIAEAARSAVQERGLFTLCLTGGRSPGRAYRLLAGEDVPWSATRVFFGDDRLVPPSHAWSNYRLARRALLEHIDIPTENVHRMRGEMSSPHAAALDYEQRLRSVFGPDAAWPELDFTLLGLGPDGHVASLFPGHATLDEDQAWVVGVTGPTLPPEVRRVSLSLPTLNASRRVVFCAPGAGKRAVIDEILERPQQAARRYPAARLGGRETLWLTAP